MLSTLRVTRVASLARQMASKSKAAPTVSEIFKSMSYGPAPEDDSGLYAWLDSHKKDFGLFINGEWRHPEVSKGPRLNGVSTTSRVRLLSHHPLALYPPQTVCGSL